MSGMCKFHVAEKKFHVAEKVDFPDVCLEGSSNPWEWLHTESGDVAQNIRKVDLLGDMKFFLGDMKFAHSRHEIYFVM